MSATNAPVNEPHNFTVVSGSMSAFDLLLDSVESLTRDLNGTNRVMDSGFKEMRGKLDTILQKLDHED